MLDDEAVAAQTAAMAHVLDSLLLLEGVARGLRDRMVEQGWPEPVAVAVASHWLHHAIEASRE